MIRGQLSEMQRDAAWEGRDLAERRERTAFNLSMGGEENARAAGLVATGTGASREGMSGSERDRDQKRRDDLERAAMEAHARYIQMLEDEMDRISDQIDANDEVLQLLRAGRLDRENPDHISLIIAAGLDPDMDDDDLRASAIDNGRSLRRHYEDVAGTHRRATNPQNDEERAQALAEIQRWRDQGEPQQADHLTTNLTDATLIRSVDEAAGLTDEEREFAMDAFEGDSFSGNFGNYEAFADEVDPDGAAQSPADDEPDQPDGGQTGGIQRDGVDFGHNSGSGPSGMGG